jgi:flavin-dependent dehydrogenase
LNQFIIEPERKLNVTGSCDVLVAGGGIAGISAAIAAARNGKKVTLVEREYGLGGMATLGLITIYLPLCDGEGNQVVFGIAEELFKLSIEHGAESDTYPEAWLNGGSKDARIEKRFVAQYNPHLFALRAEALLTKLGVTILYGTVVCAVKKEGNAISHVILENKSGRTAIAVNSVIDSTGDADICHLAGAKTTLHAKGNGLASWYYYIKGGEVRLKMFGLADVAQGQTNNGKNDAADDEYKNVKVASLDQNLRFSGVDGDELSRAVIAAHEKMY